MRVLHLQEVDHVSGGFTPSQGRGISFESSAITGFILGIGVHIVQDYLACGGELKDCKD
jgi:hypothetical protein